MSCRGTSAWEVNSLSALTSQRGKQEHHDPQPLWSSCQYLLFFTQFSLATCSLQTISQNPTSCFLEDPLPSCIEKKMTSSLSLCQDSESGPEAPHSPPPPKGAHTTTGGWQRLPTGWWGHRCGLSLPGELQTHRGRYSSTCSLQAPSFSSFSVSFHLLMKEACS